MASQSLKNLTILNFAQLLHANSQRQEKQLWQILEKLVKYFLSTPFPKMEILPLKLGLTATSHQYFINNSSNN